MVKEEKDTWYQEYRFIGRKRVDRSILEEGTPIPLRIQGEFLSNTDKGDEIKEGEKIGISLIINESSYDGYIDFPKESNKKRKSRYLKLVYGARVKNLLKEVFKTSYNYIYNYKSIEGKVPRQIPEEHEEFIDFYKGKEKNSFIVKLIPKEPFNLEEEENIVNELKWIDSSLNKEIINYRKIESECKEIDYINKYIKSKGYSYSEEIINNFYLSIKTKPFVILSGISGTGKSKFVKLFAEAIGATVNNGRFNLIPVRPDWSDDSELIGYRDIEGKFKSGIITSIAKKAMENKKEPYFICLDEMNLARVEYYFSTVLSLMETREFIDGEIKTNRLLSKENFGDDSEAYNIYGDVYIPENIYIIGTVNMDETTFPFSKKVLDRANTIEFNEINLDFAFDKTLEKVLENRVYSNYLLRSPYVKLEQCKDNKEIAYKVINDLNNINKILMEENYHFAYRVRDEIIFFVINAVNSGLMTYEMAMDYSIMQKILPKVLGSSKEVPKILINLFNSLNGTSFRYDDIAYGSIDIKEFENIRKKTYEISSSKIIYMIKRYIRDGFTGFWQ